MENSCYGCEERKLGCHATCEKYSAYKEKRKQILRAKYEISRRKTATIAMQKSMIDKIKKGR